MAGGMTRMPMDKYLEIEMWDSSDGFVPIPPEVTDPYHDFYIVVLTGSARRFRFCTHRQVRAENAWQVSAIIMRVFK